MRFARIIKSVWNCMQRLIVLLPMLTVISLLILGSLLFLVSLIPSLLLKGRDIVEFFIIIILLVYFVHLLRNQLLIRYGILYTILTISSVSIFCLPQYRSIILLQPTILFIYAIYQESRLIQIKNFFEKNKSVLTWFNIFDAIYLLAFLYRKNLDKTYVINKIWSIFNDLHLPLLLTSIGLLVIVPMLIRTVIAITIYKKQYHIEVPPNKTLGMVWLSNCICSFSQLFVIIALVEQIKTVQFESIALTFCFISFLSVLFWNVSYESLKDNGDDKTELMLRLTAISFVFIIIALLSQKENETISILMWLLPIVIPMFIGGLGKLEPQFVSTQKLDRHVYQLTMFSFNTLLIYRLQSVCSVEINENQYTLKSLIVYVLKDKFEQDNSGFVATLILLLLSLGAGYELSKFLILLLKRVYLNSDNGYFIKKGEKNNARNTLQRSARSQRKP
ncbi:hypothetical protein [Streptococcus mutans]|uniref:hypothetical protein n=1 Tax=Streptococcus mutans TaxID=1309 RepID=UPI0002B5793E|nr:hypothetical protein [Streptococcus mutans]EMC53209.1 hypothetical protein SMU105_08092 [Streptococcus mutans SF12]